MTVSAEIGAAYEEDDRGSGILAGRHCNGARTHALAYQRTAHEPDYGSARRVFLRSLRFVGSAVRR